MPYPRMLLAESFGVLLIPAAVGLALGSGCAHQQPKVAEIRAQSQKKMAGLTSRLQEVERTNGRLNVRIEELEDQLFLLQDMSESNRIALRRRGYMKRGKYLAGQGAQARAPKPTPESYYGSDNPYGRRPQRNRRDVTRIRLSRQQGGAGADQTRPSGPSSRDGSTDPRPNQPPANSPPAADGDDAAEEVVITKEEFRRFAGASATESSGGSKSPSSSQEAQPPVTDEKLGSTKQSSSGDVGHSETTDPAEADHPLDVYKGALADYRGGEYAKALSGFESFLDAGPNPNYLDNALYWIGECHYGMSDYTGARTYFQRVLREQPDGNKVPAAMLKMSLTYQRMGKADQARTLLEKLTRRYPSTNAGRLGAQKLTELQE